MSRVQLALNVDDLDEAVAFYRKLFGTEPAKVRARLRQLRRSPSRRSSWSCWRTPARAAPSTTSASRSRTSTRSTPSRPGSPTTACRRPTSAAPPAATPSRTSSGSRATPNGERWEIYTVLADSPTFREAGPTGSGCCGSTVPANADEVACCS